MNKKILYGIIIPVLISIVLISAAVLTFYGKVTRDVTVNAAILFSGDNADDVIINGGESVVSEDLLVQSQTSVNVPLKISTIVEPDDAGITNMVNYLLNNSGGICPSDTCEKRIYISAEDAGINTLSDLDSISWDANTIEGYVSHIDVLIDTNNDGIKDDALVFEYAKDLSNCEVTPYPLGEISISIDENTLAWLSSGDAGPGCVAVGNFYIDTLDNWIAGYNGIDGTTNVIGFDLEIDNWIAESNSIINNIKINEEPVEITIKPNGALEFNVETSFGIANAGDYSIITEVQPRI